MAPQKIVNRNWVNGLLLLLVVGLGTLIWLSGSDTPRDQSIPLTRLLPEQINSIRIENRSGPAFSMQRRDDSWYMTGPYAVEANSARILRLLEIVVSPVHTQFAIEQNDLTEFGLAPPAATVQLNQLEIRIGGTDPINHHRYIAIGSSLYLIKDLFPHLLLASAESFVSQQILPPARELELIHTPEWQLARTPDETRVWQLTPAVTDISMDRLIEKVDEWKNAQALRVFKAPATAPDYRIEIRLQDSATPLFFGILREQQGIFLVREDLGLIYELPRIDVMLAAPAGVP